MKIKLSKIESENKINKFFKDIKNKTPKQIKKIKRLAMNKKIPLKEKRKLFCKKCLNPYLGNEKIRIKKGIRSVECRICRNINRWKIK